jgi:pimeloyl-ACP methyl ester carboxylesterase
MRTSANGIEIEYETFGDAGNDPLLLVMGLGAQLTLWDEDFCQMLADRGFFAIRYDNRDVGLSTYFDAAGAPDLMKMMMASASGDPVDAAYTLGDMADDAAGLLDALSIDRAHVVGASMGGMIAQAIAIRHSTRVKSLVSVMSTTGGPDAEPAKPEVMAALMKPAAPSREAQIEQSLELNATIASPGFPGDEQRTRDRIARDYDRAFHPEGTQRQMAAIVTSGSRLDGLAGLKMPTLVIHGDADVLVPPSNGKQTANAIPGSELMSVEGMGHDFPPAIFGRITDAIARNAAKVGGRA